LLCVEPSNFDKLKSIQDDLKPLSELWLLAEDFKEKLSTWIENMIVDIDAYAVERWMEEQIIELKRL
jgi:hypothetical protein